MANINDVKQVFTDIANATRSKTGSSAVLKPTEMASAINGIASDMEVAFNSYKKYVSQFSPVSWCGAFSNIGNIGGTAVDSVLNYINLLRVDFTTTGNTGDYKSPEDISYMFYYFIWKEGVNMNNYTAPYFDTSRATSASSMFYRRYGQPFLRIIPAYDFSNCLYLQNIFYNQYDLTELHCFGMKVSFDISMSTGFTESALVEILNNLATVDTTQTLTMGSTNLNKLTADEQAIATNKGWTLS